MLWGIGGGPVVAVAPPLPLQLLSLSDGPTSGLGGEGVQGDNGRRPSI